MPISVTREVKVETRILKRGSKLENTDQIYAENSEITMWSWLHNYNLYCAEEQTIFWVMTLCSPIDH
jgi:hypothetical protein